ncbi:hypothetical protein LUX57_09425 [Actinomadura madurae]|uniref:hypothetical protein n=1 Tax=Actinomadura madurae TaxID=1993 RepID=UPI0020D23475|nr:hypothetical protein [Actinomadura madurae]MCP9965325.1 hypothetical protein [Actinomadura madurae]
MNDVTVTSPPPIRRAMSPYTLVEATTETGPPGRLRGAGRPAGAEPEHRGGDGGGRPEHAGTLS